MPVRPGPTRPRPSPATARPAPGHRQPHNGDPATRRAAPPGASLRLPRAVLKIQARISPSPRSLPGSVYRRKYLMVIAGRGREPAPTPVGDTRASRDTRGAATRRSRRDGGHPSFPETLSAPRCVTDLGGAVRRRGGGSLNHTGELGSRLSQCHDRYASLFTP